MQNPIDGPVGTWLEGAAVRRPDEFQVALVKRAMVHGFALDEDETKTFDAAAAKVRTGTLGTSEADDLVLVEYLDALAGAAFDYLNVQCAHGYLFILDDGLVLVEDKEDHR
jgi:hypothetical protein